MFSFFKKKKESLVLPYKTDLHSHVIPGVDDGSEDLETSLFLIGKMQEWGIRNIITTPHRTDEVFENSVESIAAPFKELQDAMRAAYPEMSISHTFEYRMDEGFIRLKDAGKLVPLKGNYILVENSFIQPLWNLDQLLFDLRLKGFKPVLAHPERYSYYRNNRKELESLHDTGCLFQVNLLSLAGIYSKDVQSTALWLLEKGYLDFLSTDLHHKGHTEEIDAFLSSKAYAKLLPKLQHLMNDLI